jgi:hypothetical protein
MIRGELEQEPHSQAWLSAGGDVLQRPFLSIFNRILAAAEVNGKCVTCGILRMTPELSLERKARFTGFAV